MKYKYLFGPVPSRRLGISLGVDLVPYKVCSYNCVYCECGRTTKLTAKRKEFVPTCDVISEIRNFLSKKPEIDFITLSGSGEPTLHSGIGKIIDFIKKNFCSYSVAVLTNGSLLFIKSVRNALKNADVVLPSLDAVSVKVFRKINRPAPELKIGRIIEGIVDFSEEFKGKIFLEVFIVPGLNDGKTELEKMKKILKRINPDAIQLNSLARPGTESWIKVATRVELERIAKFFKPLRAEVIAEFRKKKKGRIVSEDVSEKIFATVRRRPVTAEDISAILGLHINEVNKYLRLLIRSRKIYSETHLGKVFFQVRRR
jgi:wyosine [tRNA(Phe)-imidazoG37] synthetase (radical SAM superfamily)